MIRKACEDWKREWCPHFYLSNWGVLFTNLPMPGGVTSIKNVTQIKWLNRFFYTLGFQGPWDFKRELTRRQLTRKCQAQGSDLVRRCSLPKPAGAQGWWWLWRELRLSSAGELVEGEWRRPTAISVKSRRRNSCKQTVGKKQDCWAK